MKKQVKRIEEMEFEFGYLTLEDKKIIIDDVHSFEIKENKVIVYHHYHPLEGCTITSIALSDIKRAYLSETYTNRVIFKI